MRPIVSTTFAFLLLGTGANAADMGRPIPYTPAPIIALPSWAGLYLGVNVGGGFGEDRVGFGLAGAPGLASAKNAFGGFLGGGQLGYNYQFGSFVAGIETDIQGTSLKSTLTTPSLAGLTASYSQSVPWFGTLRGRIGYAQDSWLVYATGGYAYAGVETRATATAGPAAATSASDDLRSGWTVGSGIEVGLTRGWSLKGEYLYVDLGSAQTRWTFPGIPSVVNDSHVTMNVVRAGLNYHF